MNIAAIYDTNTLGEHQHDALDLNFNDGLAGTLLPSNESPGCKSGKHLFFFFEGALFSVSFSPALLHVLGVAVGAELHAGGVHDDVAERHADHVVVVYGADADALQAGQRH